MKSLEIDKEIKKREQRTSTPKRKCIAEILRLGLRREVILSALVVVAITAVTTGGELQMVVAKPPLPAQLLGAEPANPTACYDGQENCSGAGNEVEVPNE